MMSKAIPVLLALASAVGVAHAQSAAAGEQKAAACIGCHGIPGYQATFPEVHKVPMIAGQRAKYIVASLAAVGPQYLAPRRGCGRFNLFRAQARRG